jgi:hypothetical protein
MLATLNNKKPLPRIPVKKIPHSLIFEVFDGKPVYYKNYRKVLNGILTPEEIMGSSGLQAFIIEYVLWVCFSYFDRTKYKALSNETGQHIDKKNNLSADIAIYNTQFFDVKNADKNYTTIPPKVQIEVNINADTEDFGSPDNYVFKKTDKLLNFGVEKVIWIMTDSKKVIVATKDANWEVINWHKEIEIMDGIKFNIGQYLIENESPFA